MTLYTIQPAGIYKKLLAKKVLLNDGGMYDDFMLKEFVPHYEWMVEHMELRGIKPACF